ncbi:abortive infection protein [Sulfurifustis variabilis]|uniref:Abortive infection protein n=1 Tax=Sulfurifustis variabilis TaxID=1675686 RepID=A0A1B4V7M3_9GAMM|nr:CPBP family intramembrane glutamic endopeptidase [Sulfurifustis variabilis]BAU49526.1 abortive infection protein [Sulfurifustis variabilis]
MEGASAFEKLKARYCLLAIVIAWYLQPGAELVRANVREVDWYWPGLFFHYYAHFAIAAFALVAGYATSIDAARMFGRAPTANDLPAILKVDLFLFCLGTGLVTLIYGALSVVQPKFVAWWLDWVYEPVVFITAEGAIPVLPNLLSALSLVVLAPVLEEILFRGYLLHRWARKWGLWRGILASSALFGALHPEPLGIAMFGVGMAVLYLRTQSLFVPMLAHGIYNGVIWLWELLGVMYEGVEWYRYGLEEFRRDWWVGAVGAVVALLMADHAIRKNRLRGPLRLPAA